MLTVTTCPTITLERLQRQFDLPKNLTQSILLKGVQAELRERGIGSTREQMLEKEVADLEEHSTELQAEISRLEKELEKSEARESELEEKMSLLGRDVIPVVVPSSLEQVVDSAAI